jgi:anti-anti-sigma regulatory factor
MEASRGATTRPETAVASRNVKRISKQRSKGERRRPKQAGPASRRATAVEPVEPMIPEVTIATATGRIVLGPSCTIHEAAVLRAHLLGQAALPGPYEIDGRAVEHIDTAGLQLVVAFALDCLERGIHYEWTGRSATLEQAIQTLGVGALLESPGGSNYSTGAA